MIKIVKDLNLPYYLTGGTALSRYYFDHRFSDDLDFFINSDPDFAKYLKLFSDYFKNPPSQFQLNVNTERINIAENFAQFFLYQGDTELKVDFVNDISVRYGKIIDDEHLGKIDSLQNILSNKISALYRCEIKDFVDIWWIAKNFKFNWRQLINEAKQKEVSIDPLEIFNLFNSFPFDQLDLIKWTKSVNYSIIKKEFSIIAKDILDGSENSLV